jgi:hypothetical protein
MQKHDGEDLGPWSEFGTQSGIVAAGLVPDGESGFGDNPDIDGFGDAPVLGGPELGDALKNAAETVRELTPPKGYRNRVDADGDGDLDKATYRGRADGGADILVDLNKDGRTDFVGHDVDLDHRVDFADYDKNHDGVFEKRMYDDDGDGWLDRTVWTPES